MPFSSLATGAPLLFASSSREVEGLTPVALMVALRARYPEGTTGEVVAWLPWSMGEGWRRRGGGGGEGLQTCACGVVVCERPEGRGARQVKAMVPTSTAKLTPPTPLQAVELISPSQKWPQRRVLISMR